MEIADLYKNLNLISVRIIQMFQEHQYDELRAVQKVVNEYTPCAEEKVNKVFSRLIMIYHPDRLKPSLERLEKAFMEGEMEYTSRNFLTTLKRRVYGNLNVDFPVYLLEDLENIEACRYVRVVDLTNNHIGMIDALSNVMGRF